MAVVKYSEKVLEHFRNPKNIGLIENPDGQATVGSPACGDQVSVYVKVEDNKVSDIKFLSYGCASNIATGSIVTEMVKGKTITEAKALTWKDAVDELGGLPPVKIHCSVLAIDGLRAAIQDYEEKTTGIKQERKIDELSILEELKKVIYPKNGRNIVDTNMIRYLSFEDSRIYMEISMEETDVFKQNVLEEIHEHLEALQGVNSVEVKVVEY
jgi:nitrogen fixation NifU-like protein